MKNNFLIIFAALLFGLFPLLWTNTGVVVPGSFYGTDTQAVNAIKEIAPGYQPWFAPLWDPAAKGVENLLFSLQAALGAGFIAYYLLISRKKKKETS
jgi:cobalt/nickel transport protein